MQAACMQADDGEDYPEYPQHLVRCLRHGKTLAMDRLESGRVGQTADRLAPPTARDDTRGRCQGDRRGRKAHPEMALYLWLVAITGARRGELCALQVCDIDLDNGVLHIAYNYVVCDGHRVRKDTKTHQDRHLAIDPVTCANAS